MKMVCPGCGSPVTAEMKFCGKCGENLSKRKEENQKESFQKESFQKESFQIESLQTENVQQKEKLVDLRVKVSAGSDYSLTDFDTYKEKIWVKRMYVMNSLLLGTISLLWLLLPACRSVGADAVDTNYGFSAVYGILMSGKESIYVLLIGLVPAALLISMIISLESWEDSFLRKRRYFIIPIVSLLAASVVGTVLAILWYRQKIYRWEFTLVIVLQLFACLHIWLSAGRANRLFKKLQL